MIQVFSNMKGLNEEFCVTILDHENVSRKFHFFFHEGNKLRISTIQKGWCYMMTDEVGTGSHDMEF